MELAGRANEDDAVASADAMARRVAETLMAREGASGAWGFKLEDARVGYARVRMVVRPEMLNGHRTAHGGVIFALADTAFAYACNSRDQAAVAAQASIIFLAPAGEGEVLIAEAQEQAAAGRSGAYTATVATASGQIVASFQGLARSVGGSILNRELKV